MLLLKRIITSVVLFGLMFVAVWVGVLSVGATAVTVRAVMQARVEHGGAPLSRGEGAELGRKAGREFGRAYGGVIAWIAFGVSAIAAPAISFGGLFVWCRKRQNPPPMR